MINFKPVKAYLEQTSTFCAKPWNSTWTTNKKPSDMEALRGVKLTFDIFEPKDLWGTIESSGFKVLVVLKDYKDDMDYSALYYRA
ncbi:unnamed protein product [Allacma fusca]|uniref:Uncharacterized protein n=1 Tax=Allacma fusca TaxID=39272 RepID=A0A8J2NYQ3_9HEXA|nr:unnamed protein product [Allacma fusca]